MSDMELRKIEAERCAGPPNTPITHLVILAVNWIPPGGLGLLLACGKRGLLVLVPFWFLTVTRHIPNDRVLTWIFFSVIASTCVWVRRRGFLQTIKIKTDKVVDYPVSSSHSSFAEFDNSIAQSVHHADGNLQQAKNFLAQTEHDGILTQTRKHPDFPKQAPLPTMENKLQRAERELQEQRARKDRENQNEESEQTQFDPQPVSSQSAPQAFYDSSNVSSDQLITTAQAGFATSAVTPDPANVAPDISTSNSLDLPPSDYATSAVPSSLSFAHNSVVPQDLGAMQVPLPAVDVTNEKIAVSPMLDASFYATTDNILNQAESAAFGASNVDSIRQEVQTADSSVSGFAGDLSFQKPAATEVSGGAPSYAVPSLDVMSDAGNVGYELGKVDHPALGSGSAAGGETSPQEDTKRCPKCNADLHGQFAFCLSCLTPL